VIFKYLLWQALFGSYISLFVAWLYVLIEQILDGFFYLYVGVIGLSCLVYLITEAIVFVRSDSSVGISKDHTMIISYNY
jgi:hypothetical protein